MSRAERKRGEEVPVMTCVWNSAGIDWRLWQGDGDAQSASGGRIRCDPGAEPHALAEQLGPEFDRLQREYGYPSRRRWRLHWAWNGGSEGLGELLQAMPRRWKPVRLCGPGPELVVAGGIPLHPEELPHDGIYFEWNGSVHAVLSGKGEILHRSRAVGDAAHAAAEPDPAWLLQTAALWKCKTGLAVGRWWSLNELLPEGSVDELMHRSLVQPAEEKDRHYAAMKRIWQDEISRRSRAHLQRGLGMVLAAVALSGLAACRSADTEGGRDAQEKWHGMRHEINTYNVRRSEQMLNDELDYAASHALPELFDTLPVGLKLRSAAYNTDATSESRKPRGVWRIQGIALSKEQMPTLENWTETISLRPGVGEVTAVNISQMENLIQFKIETEVRP